MSQAFPRHLVDHTSHFPPKCHPRSKTRPLTAGSDDLKSAKSAVGISWELGIDDPSNWPETEEKGNGVFPSYKAGVGGVWEIVFSILLWNPDNFTFVDSFSGAENHWLDKTVSLIHRLQSNGWNPFLWMHCCFLLNWYGTTSSNEGHRRIEVTNGSILIAWIEW